MPNDNLPRVGCGAAIIQQGKVLLVRRRRAPEAGCFETIKMAVAREIREELGITIRPETLLCCVDQIDQAAGQHWVALVYRVAQYDGTPTIMEPDALSDMGWFALDMLPTPLTQATQQAVLALATPTG